MGEKWVKRKLIRKTSFSPLDLALGRMDGLTTICVLTKIITQTTTKFARDR
jgi:hypothetical protein